MILRENGDLRRVPFPEWPESLFPKVGLGRVAWMTPWACRKSRILGGCPSVGRIDHWQKEAAYLAYMEAKGAIAWGDKI